MNTDIDKLGRIYNCWAIFIIIFGGILICIFPWLFTRLSGILDFTQTGQIGDTIGGITAPIIGFMSALLIYFSFMIQYRANRLQWKAIKEEQLLNRIPIILNEIESMIKSDKILLSAGIRSIVDRMITDIVDRDIKPDDFYDAYNDDF